MMQSYHEQMTALWGDAYASGKDRWSRVDPGHRISTFIAGTLPPDRRILDVGTGRGLDVACYAAPGHRVTGIDLVALPEWVGIAERWPGVRFEQAALVDHAPHLPYDVVVDAGCFHHQRPADLDAYLAAIGELVQPAGTFWLATLRPRGADNPHAPAVATRQSDGSYTLAFDDDAITALLAVAGFTVRDTTVVRRDRRNGLDDLILRATPC